MRKEGIDIEEAGELMEHSGGGQPEKRDMTIIWNHRAALGFVDVDRHVDVLDEACWRYVCYPELGGKVTRLNTRAVANFCHLGDPAGFNKSAPRCCCCAARSLQRDHRASSTLIFRVTRPAALCDTRLPRYYTVYTTRGFFGPRCEKFRPTLRANAGHTAPSSVNLDRFLVAQPGGIFNKSPASRACFLQLPS